MNNLLSYSGLVDAKIRASDIDLPVQFMREKGHTNVIFVRLTTKEKKNWKNTKQLCMKERSHSNAIFVALNFREGIR
jgi:hypothetical protein